MPKGPLITDEVRVLASKLHDEHPKWTNAMIREEIRDIVHRRDKFLPKGWPSKYAIDRIMPEIREQVRQSKLSPDPIDKPWSTTSMARYPISPEALPTVLALWGWMREGLDYSLTIREAQWAARLYTAADRMPVDVFSLICRAHATTEMIYDRVGVSRTPWHHVDLTVLKHIIGKEMTPEQEEKILGEGKEAEDELLIALSDMEAASATQSADLAEQLGIKFEIYDAGGRNQGSHLLRTKHRSRKR